MDDPVAAGWREALVESVRPAVAARAVLCLSGGLDSVALLAAMRRLGARPRCYVFHLSGVRSADAVAAYRVARAFGLTIERVPIPRSDADLVRDVRRLVALVGPRKTAVQCAHGMLYVGAAIGQLAVGSASRTAVVGTGGIVEDNRKLHVLLMEGEDVARRYREEKLVRWDRQVGSGTWAMHEILRAFGVGTFEPYAEEPVRSVGLAIDVREVNRPRAKALAVRAFPEIEPFWRPRSSAQVGSGIREYHERLLELPEMNRRGLRAVVGVYNDVERELPSGGGQAWLG